MRDLKAFEQDLLSKGKSSSTAKSYVKNVARCLKKDDVLGYIGDIKSSSHRSFVNSAWKAWCAFAWANGVQKTIDDQIALFEVMKSLDAELVLSAMLDQRKEAGSSIIYMTQKGVLSLSKEQEEVLLKFSTTDRLVDLS